MQARKALFGILKLLPFAIITALGVLIWYDDYFAFVIAFALFWLTYPALILTFVFFFTSIRCRDKWELATVIWGAVNVLLVAAFFMTRPSVERCNPDIMAANYEEHHTEMEGLREYLHEALKDSCEIELVLEGEQLERFYVGNYYGSDNYNKGEAQSRLDSMMAVAGLSQEEYANVKQRLKSMHCKGVTYDQYTPDRINIRFRCDKWGCYQYNIQIDPITDKAKENLMKNNLFIPYNEYCTFVYDGSAGAFDSGGFSESEKRRFLRKHKPW